MKRRIDSVFWQSLCLNSIIVLVITIALAGLSIELDNSSRRKEQKRSMEIMSDRLNDLSDQLGSLREYLRVIQDASTVESRVDSSYVQKYAQLLEEKSSLINRIIITYPANDIIVTVDDTDRGIREHLSYYNVGNVEEQIFTTQAAIVSEKYFAGTEQTADGFIYTVRFPSAEGAPAMNVAVYLNRASVMSILFPEDMARHLYAELHYTPGNDVKQKISTMQGDWYNSPECYQTTIKAAGLFVMHVRIENQYFDSRLSLISHYIALILVVTIFCGIAMAYFASTRQNRPVRKAIHELSERGLLASDDRNVFNGLLTSVDNLMTEKEAAQKTLSSYQVQLRDNMLDRLFASTVHNPALEENIAMEFEHFPRKSVVYYCKLLITAADDSQSMEMTVMMLLEFLRKRLPEDAILHSTDTLTFGLVYPFNGSESKTEKELEKLLNEVPKYFSAQVVAVSGGCCESIAAVGMCYERAQLGYYASSERREPRQVILEPDDPLAFDEALQLRPLHTMYQYMASGDSEHAVAALETFFVCPTDVQLIDIRERYCALKVQILLACREIAPNCAMPLIPNFRISDSAEEQLDALTRAVRQVSGYVQQRQSTARDDQFTALLEYLHNHYSDSSLCAASLADEFRVSEKYLFSLFKKKTGYSPISYLHHIRMQQAAKMLVESDLTAQEISEQVGFANFGTFHKAFKREFGLAPSKYRETAVRS